MAAKNRGSRKPHITRTNSAVMASRMATSTINDTIRDMRTLPRFPAATLAEF